jgi:hypothetical protein
LSGSGLVDDDRAKCAQGSLQHSRRVALTQPD